TCFVTQLKWVMTVSVENEEGYGSVRNPSRLGGRVGDHGFDRLEHHGGTYVIVCACGWRSARQPSAQQVGDAWDVHRALAESRRK
ncbi:MAG: hypothetical protein ACRD0P_34880, partial [Stackebrandtia sp.]